MFSSRLARNAPFPSASSAPKASIAPNPSGSKSSLAHAHPSATVDASPSSAHSRALTTEWILPPVPRQVAVAGVPVITRLCEIVIASLVLILSFPVMLIVGLIVKLGTPGPVLFRQKRIGLDGKLFTFVKFRTFHADARQRFPDLYSYAYDSEQLRNLKFKVVADPRVSPQGEWLRKSTLDELPNFWNVLTGDMALVGPRPEIPEMVAYYHDDMLLKFAARPGVTGLAQVSGRGRLGFNETVDLDVQYVRTRSAWLDIKIIFKTMRIVVMGDGAF